MYDVTSQNLNLLIDNRQATMMASSFSSSFSKTSGAPPRRGVRAAARGDRSIGDVRNRLSKLRPENQGRGEEAKRRDQGYLRVDENLLRNDDTADKIARTKKPVQERRFNDKLARESSEFIWNSDWKKELDTWEKTSNPERGDGGTATSSSAASPSAATLDAAPAERGISFSRVSELNDLSVDLSDQLRSRKPAAEADATTSGERAPYRGGKREFLDFPGRVNTEELGYNPSRAKFAGDAYDSSGSPSNPASAEAANKQYSDTKVELFLYTLLTGLATEGMCYEFYGQDIAISYGVGCLASLFYLRLLSRTVDSVASEDAAAQVGGAGGQARLLVPAILVLGYSKANQSVAENYGVHLNIIAILAGFFTYKAGTFGQVLKSTILLMAQDKEKRETEA